MGDGRRLTDGARRGTGLPPAALATAVALAFLGALGGALLDPAGILAVRDVAQLHLPLRSALVRLCAEGVPTWNPWMSGGQPLLSDPSYSAFYPPTWLAAVVPPGWSISLHALLHLALALAGAWRLARALGCRASTALVAGVGYAGGGTVVSLVWALNDLPGAAWMPWVLAATLATVRDASPAAAWRGALGLAAGLGLVLLNGEPVTALLCVVGATILALATSRGSTRPGALARVATGFAGAAALAAIQLLPAVDRLRLSSRGAGLGFDEATTWSTTPLRALELMLPRLFGDPARSEQGLYFGWGVHDLDFPFLPSVFPGLAILLLAITGLAARAIPARGAWIALSLLGTTLALGRHTPIYELLHRYVPPFASVRYPEKFALLVAIALAIAAALTLEHWLTERDEGRPTRGDLPVALALVAAAVAGSAATVVFLAPGAIVAWITEHSAIAPGPAQLGRALALYRAEAVWTFGGALAVLAIFVAARARRTSSRAIALALIALTAVELVRLHRPLLPTRPAAAFAAGPTARRLLEHPGRVWASSAFDRRPDLIGLDGDPAARALARRLERLEPWTGMTWGISYALATDFASSFTAPLRRAIERARVLARSESSEPLHRLLGAWGASHLVLRTSPLMDAEAFRATEREASAARVRTNPYALPIHRFAPEAASFGSGEAALAATATEGWRLNEREYLVGAPWPGERRFDGSARVLAADDRGGAVDLVVTTAAEALLVVANTFDVGWSAEADGRPVQVLETGAGYQAIVLPGSTERVRLRYRERWLAAGGAVSALAWLALALGAGVLRRRGA